MTNEKTELKTVDIKDLGCAAFLHANNHKLVSHLRDGKIMIFTFECDKSDVSKYYENSDVKVMSYWMSLKFLKTIIHERVA